MSTENQNLLDSTIGSVRDALIVNATILIFLCAKHLLEFIFGVQWKSAQGQITLARNLISPLWILLILDFALIRWITAEQSISVLFSSIYCARRMVAIFYILHTLNSGHKVSQLLTKKCDNLLLILITISQIIIAAQINLSFHIDIVYFLSIVQFISEAIFGVVFLWKIMYFIIDSSCKRDHKTSSGNLKATRLTFIIITSTTVYILYSVGSGGSWLFIDVNLLTFDIYATSGIIVLLKICYEIIMKLDNVTTQKQLSKDLKCTVARYLSHQLRTPMNTVTLALQCLKSYTKTATEGFSCDAVELVDDAICSCIGVTKVLDNIIIYESLSNGTLKIYPQIVCPNEYLNDTLNSFIEQTKLKCLKYVIQFKRYKAIDVNTCCITIDSIRFSQVINTLVNNAIKYTKKGGKVTVSVEYCHLEKDHNDNDNDNDNGNTNDTDTDRNKVNDNDKDIEKGNNGNDNDNDNDSGNKKEKERDIGGNGNDSCRFNTVIRGVRINASGILKIRVTDTGRGIAKEILPELFERSLRFNPGLEEKDQGSGLSLWITRRLVDLHRYCTLSVKSEGIGKGTEFVLSIPFYEVSEDVFITLRRSIMGLAMRSKSTHQYTPSNNNNNSDNNEEEKVKEEDEESSSFNMNDDDEVAPAITLPKRQISQKSMAVEIDSGRTNESSSGSAGRNSGKFPNPLSRTVSMNVVIGTGMGMGYSGSGSRKVAVTVTPSVEGSKSNSNSNSISIRSLSTMLRASTVHIQDHELNRSHGHNRSNGSRIHQDTFVLTDVNNSTYDENDIELRNISGKATTPTGYHTPHSPLLPLLPAMIIASHVEKRVLIVDDAPMTLKMIVRVMKSKCKFITEAKDGAEAVERMKEAMEPGNAPFHFVLMDYQMPVMDGPSAAKAMRAMGFTGPIIGVTGNAMDSDVKTYLTSGANEVLMKPLDVLRLEDVLKDYGLHL